MSTSHTRAWIGIVVAASAWACTREQKPAQTAPAASPPSATAPSPQTFAALLDPARATEEAPASFKARFETTRGAFVIAARRDWAPLGVDRFYNLVKIGFYDGAPFFRVLKGFIVQFGLNGDPRVNAAWQPARFADDPVTQTNRRGTVTFATAGPGTRTTQLFINYGDNGSLDSQGFAPIGEVIEGMATVETIYDGYGQTPDQFRIQAEGNAYLQREFPRLDFIKRATLVK